ncbi:MAG: SDR family NAD(P)-dependent oxidoreductase, partial [Acidobacteria bacterium]|nr:SDR family NAD(P)-dependent oxidoreductase [Acidobacteriota bacterium]
ADLLQSFLETLPATQRPSAADTDRVMRSRSIDRIVDVVLEVFGAATPVAAAVEGPCPSFVSVESEAPLNARQSRRADGAVIVTEDEIGVTPLVVAAIQQAGGRAFVLSREDASSAEHVERRIAQILAEAGRVGAVLHLAPLSRTPMPQVADEWQRRTQTDVKALFQLLRALGTADPGVTTRLCTVAASLMGGRYGRDGQLGPGAPTGGAAVGMLRCLDREWPGSSGRAVDFAGSLAAADIAAHVIDELQHADDHVEVGYPDGARRAFGTAVTPRESGPADPALASADGWVVLATGGARGITAEAVQSLARQGVTIVLASRTPLPSEASEPAEHAALDAAGLRQAFIRAAAARQERVTPVQIDARVTRVLHDRDLRRVRAALEATGARVISQACDVSNADALAALVRGLYDTYGRLDAIIHGAGLIEDGLVVNKTPASFDRVFDTKVNAAFALARAVRPDGLKLAVFFSSVSGRAGNAGQIDYAAANEVLSRMAWWLRGAWPQTRVVSIAWGPWAGQGMASESVRARLRERGIEPIEPAAGRALLDAEMASSHRADVEIVAGIGPWDEGGPHAPRTLKLTTSR